MTAMAYLQSMGFTSTDVPYLTRILEFEKIALRKLCISGTVGVPHLHVHKPKIAVVGLAVVKNKWGPPVHIIIKLLT